jgi:hypothetical protein
MYSGADDAYDTAFEEAVGGGFGAYRIKTQYVDEDDEEDDRQKVVFEPIPGAEERVFFDLSALRQDKVDANHCFVINPMTRQAYSDEYGAEVSGWNRGDFGLAYDWFTPDTANVAEYYVKEKTKKRISIYKTLAGETEKYDEDDFEEDPELESKLSAVGTRFERTKTINANRVHKYVLSGSRVLEDCGYIAGCNIPVVPVYGERWYIKNVERYRGHVRLAKDPARLKNMQISKLAELSAISSTEKPIFVPEQIAGFETLWAEDTINDNPYLLINPVTDASGNVVPMGAVSYTKPPQVPQALAALLQLTEQDMQDILGRRQDGEKIRANTSGEAVVAVQEEIVDTISYGYIANFAKAKKRGAEIWLGMARDVYIEDGRELRTVAADDSHDFIALRQPAMVDGVAGIKNDISDARLDAYYEIGATHKTKRQATINAITRMIPLVQDPQDVKVLSNLALMNMDGEGLQEARDYYRKSLIKMGVIKPTQEEQQQLQAEMQAVQPDANAEYLKAAADKERAQTQKLLADTQKVQADTDKIRVDTMASAQDVDLRRAQAAIAEIERM